MALWFVCMCGMPMLSMRWSGSVDGLRPTLGKTEYDVPDGRSRRFRQCTSSVTRDNCNSLANSLDYLLLHGSQLAHVYR
jgi:hypothetical protein